MIVMMIAITPSLNASSRPGRISPPVARSGWYGGPGFRLHKLARAALQVADPRGRWLLLQSDRYPALRRDTGSFNDHGLVSGQVQRRPDVELVQAGRDQAAKVAHGCHFADPRTE